MGSVENLGNTVERIEVIDHVEDIVVVRVTDMIEDGKVLVVEVIPPAVVLLQSLLMVPGDVSLVEIRQNLGKVLRDRTLGHGDTMRTRLG